MKGLAYRVTHAVSPNGTTTFFKGEPSKEYKVLDCRGGEKIFFDPHVGDEKQRVNKIFHADGIQSFLDIISAVPIKFDQGALTMKKAVAETSIMKTTMHVFPDKRQKFERGPDGRMFKEILADGTEILYEGRGEEESKRVVHNTDGSIFYYRGDRGNEFLTYQVFDDVERYPDISGRDHQACHKYVTVNQDGPEHNFLSSIEWWRMVAFPNFCARIFRRGAGYRGVALQALC